MKLTCNKEILIKEIQSAQKIITQKNTISIISNVLLETENDQLIIKATDAKLRFETQIPVTTEEEGKIAIYCDKFLAVLKVLPDGDVVLDTKDNNVSISIINHPNIQFSMKFQSPDNFPWANDPSDNKFFQVPQKMIIEMIAQTIFAISDDETRIFMNGVYLEQEEGELIMVATDGRRLSLIKTPMEELPNFKGVIIPTKFLQMIKDLSYGQGMLSLAIEDKHIYVRVDNVKIASSLIEGQFPAYKRVIPETQTYKIILNKNEFKQAIKRVALMADNKSKRMFCRIENNSFELSVEENKMGTAKETLTITYDGKSMPFALNFDYLIAPLNSCTTDNIMFSFTHSDKAITLSCEPEENYFHIVMPMQLDTP